MKTMIRTLQAAFIATAILMGAMAATAAEGTWKEMAKLSNQGDVLAVLYVKSTIVGKNTRYQWAVENTSSKTMYEVSVDDATYTTSAGSEKHANGYIGTIQPGQKKTLISGEVDGRLTSIRFDSQGGEVEFSYEKDWVGNKKKWSAFGKISYNN